ncbi:hypothetical protein ABT366_37985, partial [Streptomyces lydicus]
LRRAAESTAADYRALARHLRTGDGPPEVLPRPLDLGSLLAVAPPVPPAGTAPPARADSAALLVDSVIWLDALTADLARIHREM